MISSDGSILTHANEPLSFELVFENAPDMTGELFTWTIYDTWTRTTIAAFTVEAVGNTVSFYTDAVLSEEVYNEGRTRTYHEIAQQVEGGRIVWVEGPYNVVKSSRLNGGGSSTPSGPSVLAINFTGPQTVIVSQRGAPGPGAAEQLGYDSPAEMQEALIDGPVDAAIASVQQIGTDVRADADAAIAEVLAAAATRVAGPLPNGVWVRIPSIYRLRLTGTGTVTLDARDSLGAVTTNVASFTVTGATNQIEYPYLGGAAVEVRASLTGSATAEML